jgi:hypothetical protein
VSTRLLVYTGELIGRGIAPRRAAEIAVVHAVSDDARCSKPLPTSSTPCCRDRAPGAAGAHEERLALFAEGIAGRYFHIKAAGEFAGRPPSRWPPIAARSPATPCTCRRRWTRRTMPRSGCWRCSSSASGSSAATLHLTTALDRLPGLTDREVPTLAGRASDFERFYHQFPQPALMSRLFICVSGCAWTPDGARLSGHPPPPEPVTTIPAGQRPPEPVDGLGRRAARSSSAAPWAPTGPCWNPWTSPGRYARGATTWKPWSPRPATSTSAAGTAMALYGLTGYAAAGRREPWRDPLLDDELGEPQLAAAGGAPGGLARRPGGHGLQPWRWSSCSAMRQAADARA